MLRSFTLRKFVFPLKCLVSGVLLYALFSRVDAGAVLTVLSNTQLSYLPAALCLLVVAQLLSAVRWGLLARSLGFDNSFAEFARFYWIGMFFNLFLPSIIGGDVGRAFYLVQSKKASSSSKLQWTGKAATSVITDRAVGMMALVWMTAVMLLVSPVSKLPESVRYVTFALAIAIPLLWFLLTFLSRFLQRWFYTFGAGVADALDTYRSNSRLAMFVLALAVGIQLLTSIMYLPIGWSLGIDLPRSYAFVTYAMVVLLSALPITFYGIGIRESALVFMLAPIDVPAEKALAFGVLWFFTVLILNLTGGVAFLIRTPHSEAAVGES